MSKRFPESVPTDPVEFHAFMVDVYNGVFCEYSDSEAVHGQRDRAMQMLLEQLGYDLPVPKQTMYYA